MVEPAAPAAGAAQPQQQQGGSILNTISRLIIMYMIYNWMFGTKTVKDPTTGEVIPPAINLFKSGESLNLYIYLSESNSSFPNFDSPTALLWSEKNVIYSASEPELSNTFVFKPVPQVLQNNGSLYAHVFFVRPGNSHNPKDTNFDRKSLIYGIYQLNRHFPQKKQAVKKNLLSGEIENPEALKFENSTEVEILNFWNTNFTINLIEDQNAYARGSLPPQIERYFQYNNETGNYYPVMYFNEFWTYREHWTPINETVKELNLTVTYSPLAMWKWQFMVQMEESFSMQRSMGTAQEGDSDEFKRMLTDTNPYLLGITFIVTILHSVFDFLAFKNDITFWKNKKTFEGMSVRTMFLNTICQVIIFLYLLDNDTSWVIIISSGVGLLIEFWKIRKACIVELDWTKRFPLVIRDRESYAAETKKHDEVAMRYLSYVLYPLIFCYAVYSLYYETHKSWYSFVLGTLTGCVYTFGFIMMCPQLYLNYKLKSVAHLPFRAFMYKALNTFIDDLFAFIIKMPTMHRLSCFRDDIIFLIYLYQRWIYPVDKRRVNEFGQGGEDEDTATAQTPQPIEPKTEEEKKKD